MKLIIINIITITNMCRQQQHKFLGLSAAYCAEIWKTCLTVIFYPHVF